MKKIERFLNHIYYAVFRMTDGFFSTPSPLLSNEYQSRDLSDWLFHGLSYFLIFDSILFLLTIFEYIVGYNIMRLFHNPLIFTIVMVAIIIPIDEIIFHHYVYRNNKYVDYCREFEKESKLRKTMWCMVVVFLFVIAVLFIIGIIHFRQLYLPKP